MFVRPSLGFTKRRAERAVERALMCARRAGLQVESGEIIAEGTPEVIAQTTSSYTGKFLAELLPKLNGKR